MQRHVDSFCPLLKAMYDAFLLYIACLQRCHNTLQKSIIDIDTMKLLHNALLISLSLVSAQAESKSTNCTNISGEWISRNYDSVSCLQFETLSLQ